MITGHDANSGLRLPVLGGWEGNDLVYKDFPNHDYMVLGSNGLLTSPANADVVPEHEYAVVAEKSGALELFNPWGVNSKILGHSEFIWENADQLNNDFMEVSESGAAPPMAKMSTPATVDSPSSLAWIANTASVEDSVDRVDPLASSSTAATTAAHRDAVFAALATGSDVGPSQQLDYADILGRLTLDTVDRLFANDELSFPVESKSLIK
jgi:hypothetical protein